MLIELITALSFYGLYWLLKSYNTGEDEYERNLQPNLQSDINMVATERRCRAEDRNQQALDLIPPARDIYTKADLERLLSKAKSFIISRGRHKRRLKYFYRDKSKRYYDKILSQQGGIMQVYLKDFHGDPRSPINGCLQGLFFSVNVQFGTSEPVYQSVYGEKRIRVDPETLYCRCPKLYFTDFYCIHKPHYVTLVMTRSGSIADRFCERHLIKLDWQNNAFLERSCDPFSSTATYRVISCGLWVEVFFTEDVEIRGYPLDDVIMTGYRSGGSVGLKKNSHCELCNI